MMPCDTCVCGRFSCVLIACECGHQRKLVFQWDVLTNHLMLTWPCKSCYTMAGMHGYDGYPFTFKCLHPVLMCVWEMWEISCLPVVQSHVTVVQSHVTCVESCDCWEWMRPVLPMLVWDREMLMKAQELLFLETTRGNEAFDEPVFHCCCEMAECHMTWYVICFTVVLWDEGMPHDMFPVNVATKEAIGCWVNLSVVLWGGIVL